METNLTTRPSIKPPSHKDDGWPFRAIRACPRQSDVKGSVELFLNDTGKIIEHNDGGWVQVSLPRRNIARAIIPKSCIEVGNENKWGEWTVELHAKRSIPPPTTSAPPTGSILYQTVCTLLYSIRESRQNLPEIDEKYMDMLGRRGDNRDAIMTIATTLCDGCKKAGTEIALNQPGFTARDLLSRTKLVTDAHKSEGGIYTWRHAKFSNNPQRLPELAVGSTERFASRKGQHSLSSKDEENKAPQYVAWRASTEHTMHILAFLSSDKANRDTMYWCELIMILLLDSHHPAVIDKALDARILMTDGEPEDENRADDIPHTADDPPGTNTRKMMLNVDKKVIATKLALVMKSVREQTGWPGGCSRKDFGARGLNWATPCASGEPGDKMVYYKTSIPGVVDVYRKATPVSALAVTDGERIEMSAITTRGPSYFNLQVSSYYTPKKLGIKQGTKLWITIEIMQNEQHAVPYARLPEVFAYEQGDLVNRLGIRVEWEDESKIWHRLYLQAGLSLASSTTIDHTPKPDAPMSVFCRTLSLLRILQSEVVESPPKWLPQYGVPVIKELRFDDFRHVFIITETSTAVRVQAPRIIPASVREAELSRRGARYFNDFASKQPPMRLTDAGFPWFKCDLCIMMRKSEWNEQRILATLGACTESDLAGACRVCKELFGGLHCSWTGLDDITEDYRRAIMPLPPKPAIDNHTTFSGPKLQQLPTHGPFKKSDAVKTGNTPQNSPARGTNSGSNRLSTGSNLRASGEGQTMKVSIEQIDAWIDSSQTNFHEQACAALCARVRDGPDLSTSNGAATRVRLVRLLKLAKSLAATSGTDQSRYQEIHRALDTADRQVGRDFTLSSVFVSLPDRGKISNRVPSYMETVDYINRHPTSKDDTLKALRQFIHDLAVVLDVDAGRPLGFLDDILLPWDITRLDRRSIKHATVMVGYRLRAYPDPKTPAGNQARQALAKMKQRIKAELDKAKRVYDDAEIVRQQAWRKLLNDAEEATKQRKT